jgi:hypothetical protein
MPRALHGTKDVGGIAVADRGVPRWLIALCIVVISWSIYYLITFGTQYAGTFPRPENPAAPANVAHGG